MKDNSLVTQGKARISLNIENKNMKKGGVRESYIKIS